MRAIKSIHSIVKPFRWVKRQLNGPSSQHQQK